VVGGGIETGEPWATGATLGCGRTARMLGGQTAGGPSHGGQQQAGRSPRQRNQGSGVAVRGGQRRMRVLEKKTKEEDSCFLIRTKIWIGSNLN